MLFFEKLFSHFYTICSARPVRRPRLRLRGDSRRRFRLANRRNSRSAIHKTQALIGARSSPPLNLQRTNSPGAAAADRMTTKRLDRVSRRATRYDTCVLSNFFVSSFAPLNKRKHCNDEAFRIFCTRIVAAECARPKRIQFFSHAALLCSVLAVCRPRPCVWRRFARCVHFAARRNLHDARRSSFSVSKTSMGSKRCGRKILRADANQMQMFFIFKKRVNMRVEVCQDGE